MRIVLINLKEFPREEIEGIAVTSIQDILQ